MVTRHCSDHFAVYTNIESLHYTPETNVSYMSVIPQFYKRSLTNFPNSILNMRSLFSITNSILDFIFKLI